MLRTFTAYLITILTVTLLLTSCGTTRRDAKQQFGDEQVTTFYLVRHAEKDYGDDPNLIAKGRERADRLKEMLKNVDLAAVYSTDFRRTQQTAAPVAADHDLKVIDYQAALLKELSEKLRTLYRGKSVLIVGHSNTTPKMANYLTDSDAFPRFVETDYTNFLVVDLPRIGAPRVHKLRF